MEEKYIFFVFKPSDIDKRNKQYEHCFVSPILSWSPWIRSDISLMYDKRTSVLNRIKCTFNAHTDILVVYHTDAVNVTALSLINRYRKRWNRLVYQADEFLSFIACVQHSWFNTGIATRCVFVTCYVLAVAIICYDHSATRCLWHN